MTRAQRTPETGNGRFVAGQLRVLLKALAFLVGLALLLSAITTVALVAPHAHPDAGRAAVWTYAIACAVLSLPLLVLPFSPRAFRIYGSIALLAFAIGLLWLVFGPSSLTSAWPGTLWTAQLAAIALFVLSVARIASASLRSRRRRDA